MTFRTAIQLSGKTATGIAVPAEVVTGLGAGRRPAVRVTIRGYTYRSTVAPRGDRYLVGVSAVIGIEEAKQPETRQRRIDTAISRLREGRGQR